MERIFSQVNNMKTRNTNSLKSQTVAARILAKQAITKNNSDCTSWEPSKALIKELQSGTTSAVQEATSRQPNNYDRRS